MTLDRGPVDGLQHIPWLMIMMILGAFSISPDTIILRLSLVVLGVLTSIRIASQEGLHPREPKRFPSVKRIALVGISAVLCAIGLFSLGSV